MPDYREFGASNKPDTCLWCGNKLRHRQIIKTMNASEARAEGHEVEDRPNSLIDWPVTVVTGHEEKGGDYVDGFFCGLRCGYLFGQAAAKNGFRFEPLKRNY